MALIIETKIICDRCERLFNLVSSTLGGMELRKIARAAGWVYSGEDICPDCRAKNKNGNDFKHSKRRAIKRKHNQ